MDFVKIERIDSQGQTNELVVKLSSIVAIKECHRTTKQLFDAQHNLVEEIDNPRQFIVYIPNCELFYVSEKSYQELVKQLVK